MEVFGVGGWARARGGEAGAHEHSGAAIISCASCTVHHVALAWLRRWIPSLKYRGSELASQCAIDLVHPHRDLLSSLAA